MTTEAIAAPSGLTREELVEWIRDSGILDDIKDDLRTEAASNQFVPDSDGMDSLQAGMGSGGFPWQYWRKRDGRIITGPEPRETLYATYIRKGYLPLVGYGLLPTPGSPVPCCRGRFMRTDQFHVLLARGGAKEFSVEQIIVAGWHINPPVIHGKKVTFPQLRGVTIEHAACDECDKDFYGVAGKNQIVPALRQHANSRHGFSRREVDEMLWRTGYYTEQPKTAPRTRQRPRAEEEPTDTGPA